MIYISYNNSTGVINFYNSTGKWSCNKSIITRSKIQVIIDIFRSTDIVNNFLVAYVGDGKIIDHARKQDVLFHSKRAIQEFSYDVTRVEKIFEVSIPTTLVVPMPQDYVNYVKLSWVDDNGLERRIYPYKQYFKTFTGSITRYRQ